MSPLVDSRSADPDSRPPLHVEIRTAAKFAAVSLVGFGTDALLLHLGMGAGLSPAWARVVSLGCAMQVTFLLNGLQVFRCLKRAELPRQWVSYMGGTAVGNFCNYGIFVTLVSTHWPVVSAPLFALVVGAATAWMINYSCARLLVFGRPKPPG